MSDSRFGLRVHQLFKFFTQKRSYFPFLVFGISRGLVFLVVMLFAITGGTMHPEARLQALADGRTYIYEDNDFIDAMSRWDGGQYLGIVDGYGYEASQKSNVAFFPLYPMAITAVSKWGLAPAVAAVLISHICFLLALYVLYDLCRKKWSDHTASMTLIYLVCFPTAFFFSAIYTESLFLLLTVGTFWCLERKYWLAAGLVGSLATATRFLGIALLPIACLYAFQAWDQRSSIKTEAVKLLTRLLQVSLILGGIGSYIWFLHVRFGSPLAFLEAQNSWSPVGFNPIGVIIMMLSQLSYGMSYYSFPMVLSGVLAVLFVIYCCQQYRDTIGLSYLVYSAILFIVPLGVRAESLMRYTVVIFPLFIVMAVRHPQGKFRDILLSLSVILQLWLLVQFIQLQYFF